MKTLNLMKLRKIFLEIWSNHEATKKYGSGRVGPVNLTRKNNDTIDVKRENDFSIEC